MDNETKAKIDDLEKQRIEFMARSYDLEAEIDRLRGDMESAEFHAALAASWRDEPGSAERKQRAYIRSQAVRVLATPSALMHVGEEDREAVAAEVERLRSSQGAA